MPKTVLFVVTSHGDLGDTGARTGAWLEELAAPYAVFEDAGYACIIASTAGGAAPLDPMSLETPWLLPAGHRFLQDPAAMAKLEASLRLDDVDANRADILFLVGGTGTMWDFPSSRTLGRLASTMAATKRPIGAICHGVIGLLGATTIDGRPLVEGRRLTCFSNAEERALNFDTIVPMLAETALTERGALFSCAPPFESHIVRDGIVFTGQNPASAAALATSLIADQN